MQVVVDNKMSRVTMPASIKSLVVDNNIQRRVLVEELLSNMGYSTMASCATISELYHQVKPENTRNLLLVFCTQAVTNDVINDLKQFLGDNIMPALMLAEDIDTDSMREAMQAGIGSFLSLGVQSNRIKQSIESAFASFAVVNDLEQQIEGLKTRLEDRVTIDKAKGLVMKNRSLDEAHAYRFLREHAMKHGKKMVEVAEMVISTAELLDK